MEAGCADPMDDDAGPQPAEAYADYRFFRALSMMAAKLTLAGLFFIAWAAAFAFGHRWQTSIFLASTTALLLFLSLVSGFVAYALFKRRGGQVVKGPRTREEFEAERRSKAARQDQGDEHVPRDEHQGRRQPEEA